MEKAFNELLKDMVRIVNAHQENLPKKEQDHYKNLLRNHFKHEKVETIKAFFQFIKQEFHAEPETYVLLLSIIYDVTIDEYCLIEVADIILHEEIDLFTCMGLRAQIDSSLFRNPHVNRNYTMLRRVHSSLVRRLEEEIKLELPYRPFHLRNRNRIVVVTNQLLSDLHAPTAVVKEVCSTLKKNLGFEVLLVIAAEELDVERLMQVWLTPYILLNVKEYTGNFTVDCFGEVIPGYQIIMKESTVSEIRQLAMDLYVYNPFCIWYMGNLTLFPDLLRSWTSVVAMPFTDGYAISDAPIMLNYQDSQSKDVKIMEQYLKENGQTALHYDLRMSIKSSTTEIHREDYGLCDTDYVITIVGNRLDSEITEEFIGLMRRILQVDLSVKFAFIGTYYNYSELIKEDIFLARSIYMGFQEDLVGAIGLMNLFLNPPRQGGGTGAIDALYHGIPVVTLDYCDVANFVPRDYVCHSLDEMYTMVHNYIKDPVYYKEQSEKAITIRNQYNGIQLIEDTKLIIQRIEDEILNRES